MALDTSSFPAYVRSLNLTTPVNTRPGRLIPGPPAEIVEVGLWLGMGPLLFDTPRTRSLLRGLGLNPQVFRAASPRLRTRAMWLPVMRELAAPYIAAAADALALGERGEAVLHTKAALTILYIAMSGDGYYFYTPMRDRGPLLPLTRRLYRSLRELLGLHTERLSFRHRYGRSTGLLHLPSERRPARPRSLPALLALHPLGSDKDIYDSFLARFRQAGYATFCVDLPAHGENYAGPRLQPGAEAVGAAALEALARHPAIDAQRLGLLGGSLGGLLAYRTAALSPRAKAVLTYGAPFDLGHKVEMTLPGIADCFAWVAGAADLREAAKVAGQFHLRDVLDRVTCPVCVVHGTQDHMCDFTASYEIASRVKGPVDVWPLVGADHEAVYPATAELAAPGIAWLKRVLQSPEV